MINNMDWVNIFPYTAAGKNGYADFEWKYYEAFGEMPEFTYLPKDAPLERYKKEVLNAVKTNTPITKSYYDWLPKDAMA